MERLLSEAFESLQRLIDESRRAGSESCLSCDPRPQVAPMAASLAALASLLEEKGLSDFGPSRRRMEGEIDLWKSYLCCQIEAAPKVDGASDREVDARALLTEKCGANFVENRRGLRQVVRAPGDREGCYQSRACRKTDSREGLAVEAGFWTYDGEYWYIWAERRNPQGEWVACEP